MFGFRKKKLKRQEELKDLSYSLGGKYGEKDDFGCLAYLLDFKLFSIGHSRKIYNSIQLKDEEKEINIFDYQYVVQAGNTPVKFLQTVFFVRSKKLALPIFDMKPENFFHKIGQYLGMQDIDFNTHPLFSDQYLLKGENEHYIRSSFSEEILNFFSIEKKWHLEGAGYFMVLYKPKVILKPDEIKSFYEKGVKLYESFKIDEDHFFTEE